VIYADPVRHRLEQLFGTSADVGLPGPRGIGSGRSPAPAFDSPPLGDADTVSLLFRGCGPLRRGFGRMHARRLTIARRQLDRVNADMLCIVLRASPVDQARDCSWLRLVSPRRISLSVRSRRITHHEPDEDRERDRELRVFEPVVDDAKGGNHEECRAARWSQPAG
jgi:hypothetical protein